TKNVDRLKKQLKSPDKKIHAQYECAERLRTHLEKILPARTFTLQNEDEEEFMQGLHLITRKPVLYAANVGEDELANDAKDSKHVKALRDFATKEGSGVVVVSAKIEEELSQLEPAEAKEYMETLGITEPGLNR